MSASANASIDFGDRIAVRADDVVKSYGSPRLRK